MDRHVTRGTTHTVENRADEKSGKSGLLIEVYIVCDLRGIRIAGPRAFLRARHGSGAYESVRAVAEGGIEGEGRSRGGEKTSELAGRGGLVDYKSSGKVMGGEGKPPGHDGA